ncbi:type II toxin-antitoxin system VapC family toxin [Mucilaginibacter terrigena]|uniref:Type II toxin-antitoxin system VapC family toxin n=1 Tax=Mucilaginibacter terrigena TaxID=2492395 RepID=A0A4Q5LP27_9SPHI|nr:type II toxin-antitoxin system VapC family toxin [Mucilaginibacter terrigena]RYU91135.1 type II toxin-antitoxin system VapC family toxin [Mucilaginibacter terrigena]
MGKTFLIDTNILLEYTAGILPEDITHYINNIIDGGFYTSVINQIEVLGHPSATEGLSNFLDTATIHQLTEDVIKQTIELRKFKSAKLPDVIIAATAIVMAMI